MSDQILLSETERKRPNISSTNLLNLQSIITQNVTLNNNIEKPNECKYSLIQESDEIENKRRKTSSNTNDFIEYLTNPDYKSFTTRRILISELDFY